MEKKLKKIFASMFALLVLGLILFYTSGYLDALVMQWGIIGNILELLVRVNVLWIGLVIFLENKNPSRTVAWLVVLALLPLLGFFIYILFGRSYAKKRKAKIKYLVDSDRMERAADIQLGLIDYMQLPGSEKECNRRLMQLLLKNAKAPFSLSNDVTVLTNGLSKFNRMWEAVRRAEHHIHLEYFIFKDDLIGKELAALLIEKAKAGVEVRLIYDAVGSWSLDKAFIKSLKVAGIQVYPFFKVPLPIFSRDLNYRNHRKIVVIDGVIGFVGGINIGNEYIGRSDKFTFWRDTHLEIKGEAVYALQTIFLNDWNFVSKGFVDGSVYFPKSKVTKQSLVQIAASGPDSKWQSILQAFYKMIANAEEKIWIASPYLVLEDSLMMGLKTAALSGVDVRIIIPEKPDHFFVFWATQANIETLLEAGVQIYQYKNGFIHSKVMIIDRQVATVGTANMDIRSMEINFEVNAFLYDVNVITRLEEDFLRDLEDSESISYEKHIQRHLWRKLLEALGRLVSPLQ